MHTKKCRCCERVLPLDEFEKGCKPGWRNPECRLCLADSRRMRRPLAPIKRSPALVRLNNACCQWFGYVSRGKPLRGEV